MLLNKANIRVGIRIPVDEEFFLVDADDLYGYASETELSLFRLPMPTTNLKFLNAVMWEGRETTLDPISADCIYETTTCFSPVSFDLGTQANNATLGHAESLQESTVEERQAIVEFEGLFTAQIYDWRTGKLIESNASGGPEALVNQEYYFGINDTLSGDYRTKESFNPIVMSVYDAWNRFASASKSSSVKRNTRASIARGQALFNTKPIMISGVKGINDDLGISVLPGTCSTCHNIPNAGNYFIPMPMDIGISDESRRTPDMPLYTLQNKSTGETIKTTDPDCALITGKWEDVGRFKGPILRSVASRPPYFHNGAAADLPAVANFTMIDLALD